MKTETKKSHLFRNPYELAEALGIHYSGDTNIEHGGMFYNTEHWESDGYTDALVITDLDSGCGFTGGLLIEKITINRAEGEDMQFALECCGWLDTDEEITIHHEIDACQNYGHYDPVEDFGGPHYWVITTDPTSWEFDGWRAEAHIETEDLLGYLNALHMGGF